MSIWVRALINQWYYPAGVAEASPSALAAFSQMNFPSFVLPK
jgi:hypothetical protein